MNIIKHGDQYQVYSDSVETFHNLPALTYQVEFEQMRGFYLKLRPDLVVSEQKIYGNHEKKVTKAIESFNRINRNFGILLSGPKGIGKTLFLKMLAKKAIDNGLPVISVSAPVEGVAEFISSIEQDCIVIFDEFEKIFNDERGMQNSLLPLFDGLDGGHKMFVVTCNDLYKINDYMLNRPGRFHYHFTLNGPSSEEIKEYLDDKLNPHCKAYIPELVNLSFVADFTYDQLRAIVFDLNQGYSLKETMGDINISRENCEFDSTVVVNGVEYTTYGCYVDMVSHETEAFNLKQYKIDDAPSSVTIGFIPIMDIKVGSNAQFSIENAQILWTNSDKDNSSFSIDKISIKKSPSRSIARYDV